MNRLAIVVVMVVMMVMVVFDLLDHNSDNHIREAITNLKTSSQSSVDAIDS